MKKGQRVRLRFIGAGQFLHPMHMHGMSFKIVGTDGNPVPPAAELTKDTLPITPGSATMSSSPGTMRADLYAGSNLIK